MRQDYAASSFDYGDVLGAATFRRGLSDSLTGGVHAEAQMGGSYAVGADAAWQAGTLGIVSTQVALGGDAADSGWLAGVGLEHNGPRLTAYLHTQFSSRNFSQLGASLFEATPKQRTFGGIGFDFDTYGSLQFAYGMQSFYDDATVATLGLSYSLSLQRFGYLGALSLEVDVE